MTALAKIATIARVRTFTVSGIEAVPVEVQVQISGGMPALLVVGLPDKAVGEARERMRAALSAIGLALPPRRILINLAPADLLKEGSHFDLPIALGVLAAMDVVPREDLYGYAAMGELSLDGTLNAVAGVLPAAIGASTLDLGLICPASQGGEAAWAGRIEVLALPHHPSAFTVLVGMAKKRAEDQFYIVPSREVRAECAAIRKEVRSTPTRMGTERVDIGHYNLVLRPLSGKQYGNMEERWKCYLDNWQSLEQDIMPR